jgi:FMN phosphatase YigB (HAD superfamily)
MGLIKCTPEAFARARVEAGRRALRNAGRIDANVTLREIYTELGHALSLTAEQRAQLIELEQAIENELIRGVPCAAEHLENARDETGRVVFLSDMYLCGEFIQAQLARCGFWKNGDYLYVSCEHEKSKASGTLFQELLHREKVAGPMICHFGNDHDRDIVPAKRAGLQVKHFLQGNLNRYEEILESHSWATEGLTSVMAGASRLARLGKSASNAREEALRDVAAGVVAPTLVGFVLWLLQRAQDYDIGRLYFVARDGQILCEIARRLASKLNISCDVRYIYGSRRAWLVPAITAIDDDQLSVLKDFCPVPSVRNLLSRINIHPEEIKGSLRSIELQDGDWSRNLTRDERDSLYRLIKEDANLHPLILQRAAEKRSLLFDYFKQEGLLDPIAWGIVDVGWAGRLQAGLDRILAPEGKASTRGFYFGLKKSGASITGFERQEAYFFDERFSSGFVRFFSRYPLVQILETFCSADHGQVAGFERREDLIVPVLAEKLNGKLRSWGLPTLQETVYSFTDNLLLDGGLVNIEADMRGATAEVLATFWSKPNTAEAKAFADFPCDFGFTDDPRPVRFAEGCGWQHVIRLFLTGKELDNRLIVWSAGSRAATPPHIQAALKIANLVLRARRRLLRPVKSVIALFGGIFKVLGRVEPSRRGAL